MNSKQIKMERIITTATRLFVEFGFEQTSMQKIADDANIGVATLFRYFPKKELLIVAVIEQVIEEMVPLFSAISESEKSGLAKMEMILDAYIDCLIHAKQAPVILLENFDYYLTYHPIDRELVKQIQQSYKKIGLLVERTIKEGVADGSITLTSEEMPNAMTIMNLFGTAIKKHSFNYLANIGIFPIPSKAELTAIKTLILRYLAQK